MNTKAKISMRQSAYVHNLIYNVIHYYNNISTINIFTLYHYTSIWLNSLIYTVKSIAVAELNNNAIIAEWPIVRETTAVLLMSCSCPLFYRSRANLYVHVRDTD